VCAISLLYLSSSHVEAASYPLPNKGEDATRVERNTSLATLATSYTRCVRNATSQISCTCFLAVETCRMTYPYADDFPYSSHARFHIRVRFYLDGSKSLSVCDVSVNEPEPWAAGGISGHPCTVANYVLLLGKKIRRREYKILTTIKYKI
jgi:hypothetical protein